MKYSLAFAFPKAILKSTPNSVKFIFRLFSLIATDWTDWFQGSALEPTDCRLCLPSRQRSLFRLHCEARQSLGSSAFPGRARERENENFTCSVGLEVFIFRYLLSAEPTNLEANPLDRNAVRALCENYK